MCAAAARAASSRAVHVSSCVESRTEIDSQLRVGSIHGTCIRMRGVICRLAKDPGRTWMGTFRQIRRINMRNSAFRLKCDDWIGLDWITTQSTVRGYGGGTYGFDTKNILIHVRVVLMRAVNDHDA